MLSVAFIKYKELIVFKNQSKKTEEQFQCAFKSFVKFMGDIEIKDITFALIRDWKQQQKTSEATSRGYIISLRQVLKYARQQGYECIDSETIPVPKRPDTIPDYLLPDEVARLIKSMKPKRGQSCNHLIRSQLIVSLLYSTGMRVSELVALDRHTVKTDTITLIGKGGKAGIVFIDQRSRELIDKYLATRADGHPALLLGAGGRRMTTGDVRALFRRLQFGDGSNRKIHPHTLRHSYATNLLNKGCDLYSLSKLMRHADISTTATYLHTTNPQLEALYKKHHTI